MFLTQQLTEASAFRSLSQNVFSFLKPSRDCLQTNSWKLFLLVKPFVFNSWWIWWIRTFFSDKFDFKLFLFDVYHQYQHHSILVHLQQLLFSSLTTLNVVKSMQRRVKVTLVFKPNTYKLLTISSRSTAAPGPTALTSVSAANKTKPDSTEPDRNNLHNNMEQQHLCYLDFTFSHPESKNSNSRLHANNMYKLLHLPKKSIYFLLLDSKELQL